MSVLSAGKGRGAPKQRRSPSPGGSAPYRGQKSRCPITLPPIPKSPTAVPRFLRFPQHRARQEGTAPSRPRHRRNAGTGKGKGGGLCVSPHPRAPRRGAPPGCRPSRPPSAQRSGTGGDSARNERRPSEGPPENFPRRYRDPRSPRPVPVSVPEPRTTAQPVTCTHLRRFVHLKMAAGSAAGRDRPRFPPPGGAPRAAPPPPSAPTAGRGSGDCGRGSAL